MGLKPWGVHQIQGNKVEALEPLPYATGQTFLLGEPVKWSAGEVIVCAADPSAGTIVGVAMQKAGSNPGYDAANSPATFTGRQQNVMVCIPNDGTVFVSQLTNGSAVPVAVATADRGSQYGITAYSGIWTVDKAKTGGSARVTVVGIDEDQDLVFFKFLESFLDGA